MRTHLSALAAIVAAAALGLVAGCGVPAAPGTLVATSPDGMRLAVATAGARNVRVLHISGGSIVRLSEEFVPEGEAIEGIAWSEDGRNVLVTISGPPHLAADMQRRPEADGAERATGGTARRKKS